MQGRAGIAPEGWAVIWTAAGVLGTVAIVGTLAGHPASLVPLLLGVAFSLYFFRDPERQAPADPRAVVSPADGRVIDVSPVREDHFLHASTTKVSIFMSPLDVHVNRSPVDGRITALEHTAGKFRAAFHDKASLDNERNAMVLEAGGRRFLVVQIAGALARRIVCRRAVGDGLGRGERYGLIMFGSRVDVYLPAGVEPAVTKGDRVSAGSSVLARLPEV
ncbi:MAG TPA: phosphatidylserine decarboxylase family protein [Candidatus Eisenbacteria bacterium]|nr:phosphatidylserine decarboxylase family protein [Candidatus Eisenbacteria bacterium]